MKKLPYSKILALSPHTDDIEFGCGGTIARLREQGADIHTAVFSICEESVPDGFPEDILLQEMNESSDVLGIPEENRHVFSYPVRHFPGYRQDILEDLIQLKKNIQPELILTPSTYDVHQDHEVIAKESIRAFRFQNLLGYELPWNNLSFSHQMLVELTPKHLHIKGQAINCYQSQRFRFYGNPQFFEMNAKVRGIQNRKSSAEVFEVLKLLF